MEDNPYRTPIASGGPPAGRTSRRWRTACLVGVAAGVVGFFGTLFYPAEWFFEPGLIMLPLALLNLGMYLGPIVAIVGGIGWVMRR
jgi:hypothetical protein